MSAHESQPVVFRSAFEAIRRLVLRRSPAMVGALRNDGLDLEHLEPSYPKDVWRTVTAHLASAYFPNVGPETGDYGLGRLLMEEYFHTVVGKVLLATFKVLGPERVFSRIRSSFRTANNFTEERVTKLGDGQYELWLNNTHAPYLTQGFLQAALEATGPSWCLVEVVRRDDSGTTYRCRWT